MNKYHENWINITTTITAMELKHQDKLRQALHIAPGQCVDYRVVGCFLRNVFNHTVLNINRHKLYIVAKLYDYLNFILEAYFTVNNKM